MRAPAAGPCGLVVLLAAVALQAQDKLPQTVIPTGQAPYPLLTCLQEIVGTGQFKVAGPLPWLPEKGESGSATSAKALIHYETDGTWDRSWESAFQVYPLGELVQAVTIEQYRQGKQGSVSVSVVSLLKHNLTRGKGNFQHQSAERLGVELFFPMDMTCAVAKAAWGRVLAPVTPQEVAAAMAKYPSGMMVEELRQGMTPQEVEAMLGPPERQATLGQKKIYFYPKMKVVFVDGKVTDIE